MILYKIFLPIFLLALSSAYAGSNNKQDGVFVDENGVMRWNDTKKEVSLFGVNYTVPFAYSYRANKRLGLSIKKAIDLDVEQMVRLGFDAFRVHVWDREISDKLGNILENEHLDLFDYLLNKLAENNIKIILTPIAWWGTGWPEPDGEAPGFSQFYSKLQLITDNNARKAEKNYLEQFINHINPYRKISYKNDASIIAVEIINEPSHPNDAEETTKYINEMVKALRGEGFSKPIFYNISQNWNDALDAQAVLDANIQGVSFQWYPTGLVHNKMLSGNYLTNVNHYSIPSKNLHGYDKKTKMVYEFAAADVGGSYIYPAMARSFREAGMQFAAMFCYDPTQIAWSNTEYGTHFLNLLYTPSKAISLMIAGKAFHILPRLKSYGDFPENNFFQDFRVDYKSDLSLMNSDTAFYYSNSNLDIPKNINNLKHIAGCGNSSLINYDGTGAYFLDKLEGGVWKLEVYPDCLWLSDPFEPTSLKRQAARLYFNNRKMTVSLHDLGNNFNIYSLSDKSPKTTSAQNFSFIIRPGVYVLASEKINKDELKKYLIQQEFLSALYQPEALAPAVVINETPRNIFYNSKKQFKFKIASENEITKAEIFFKQPGWRNYQKKALKKVNGFNFVFENSFPDEIGMNSQNELKPGKLVYCVAVYLGSKKYTFPSLVEGSPDDWDFFLDDFWTLNILQDEKSIVLFDAGRDFEDIVFPQFSRDLKYRTNFINGSNNETTALSANIKFSNESKIPFAIQVSVNKIINSLGNNLAPYKYIELKARSINDFNKILRINILTLEGGSYQSKFELKQTWQNIKIPISSFEKKDILKMPFSYPHFLPKMWNPKNDNGNKTVDVKKINFIQIECDKSDAVKIDNNFQAGFEIESVILKTN